MQNIRKKDECFLNTIWIMIQNAEKLQLQPSRCFFCHQYRKTKALFVSFNRTILSFFLREKKVFSCKDHGIITESSSNTQVLKKKKRQVNLMLKPVQQSVSEFNKIDCYVVDFFSTYPKFQTVTAGNTRGNIR